MPSLGLDVQRRRRDRFGDREHVEERLAIDLATGRLVSHATPDVDGELAILVHRELKPDLPCSNRGIDRLLEYGLGIRGRPSAALREKLQPPPSR